MNPYKAAASKSNGKYRRHRWDSLSRTAGEGRGEGDCVHDASVERSATPPATLTPTLSRERERGQRVGGAPEPRSGLAKSAAARCVNLSRKREREHRVLSAQRAPTCAPYSHAPHVGRGEG